MEDFTGGLGEDFDLKKVRTEGKEEDRKEIFQIIHKGLRRGDLMGCSITVSRSQNLLGHVGKSTPLKASSKCTD